MHHPPVSIQVTKTWLPPLEEYTRLLEGVWARGWITNNGQLVQELESRLREFLGAQHVVLVNNGTSALQIALRALGASGEVITTPFSYVATTGAILWEHCQPVFVDIEPRTFCIDPALIEAAITPRTSAILATHVYGYPCDVEAIQKIANRHGLKVIYDAAHAFGAQYQGRSLCGFGHASALSFHATKLFHTIEGGAIVTNDAALAEQCRLMRAFGHQYDDHKCVGMNAKMSEPHAAMGLCVLPRIGEFIAARKALSKQYDTLLAGSGLQRPVCPAGCEYNYAYYPVVFPTESALSKAKAALESQQIFPRRYFWPSLNTLPYVKRTACPVSEDVATRIMCLPLHPELASQVVQQVSSLLEKLK